VSRTVIAFIIALYFVAAFALCLFMALGQPFAAMDEVISTAFGAAARIFLMSGAVPLLIWAFWKFRADRALVPLTLWAVIGLVVAFLLLRSV